MNTEKLLLSVLAVLLFCSSSNAEAEKPADTTPVVRISYANGTGTTSFMGTANHTWLGQRYYAFRGIPYAQTPVGALRFKDPQPLDKWPPVVDARYDGHDCPSVSAQNASENCLVLNVYTKQLGDKANELLPVLAVLHPGGLYIGSAHSTSMGPEYLLEHPIVLVTLNYRLGALGYLNLGTEEIPGNAGFKDQVMALKWIRDNVRHFGGDPSRVTLMGYSAGGLSVNVHLVSPLTRGLFSHAAIMSGGLPPQVVLPVGDQRALARRQAEVLNCTISGVGEKEAAAILNCLNRFNGSEIAATLRRLFEFGRDNPVYLWLPTIEHNYGQERFLTADVYGSLRKREFARAGLLVSYLDGELCRSSAEILRNATLAREFNSNFERLAPMAYLYMNRTNNHDDLNYISHRLRREYGDGHGGFSYERLCDLFSHALVRFGSARTAQLISQRYPVTRLLWTYRGRYNQSPDFGSLAKARAAHLDDFAYLFREAAFPMDPELPDDRRVVELYTKFIAEFVAHGPAPGQSQTLIDEYGIHFARNDDDTDQFAEGELWRTLFPLTAYSVEATTRRPIPIFH